MTGRHMAADRVAAFARAWRRNEVTVTSIDALIADLEALTKPRVVVRTIEQLQALAVGTVVMVQGNRAAQVDDDYSYDVTEQGEVIEGKNLVYVGTDLHDSLKDPLDKETRDTLRRMLPAIVIDPLD